VDTLSQRNRFGAAVTTLSLIFLVIPLGVMALFSFQSTPSLTFPFHGFSLHWYRVVFGSPEFTSAWKNSLEVASVVAVSTLVIGTLAAYGLSRAPARARAILTPLFFLPIALPGLFLGVGLLTMFSEAGVQLSLGTIMLAHLIYVMPFFFLIARTALDRLDPALEETAASLGASPWLRFRKVTLPQVWPVLIGAAALAFVLSLDETVITLFVTGQDGTLPVFIYSRLRITVDPTINVVSTVLLLSGTLVFLVALAVSLRGSRRLRRSAPPTFEER
jgi:spermidine/putrescine transport system permease protein